MPAFAGMTEFRTFYGFVKIGSHLIWEPIGVNLIIFLGYTILKIRKTASKKYLTKSYLPALRLNGVRRELKNADPISSTGMEQTQS